MGTAKMLLAACFWMYLLSMSTFSHSQTPSDSLQELGDFGGLFYLDSVVVSAAREGFAVEDFVKMVQEDQSFYRAFKNLRTIDYTAEHSIQLFPKDHLKQKNAAEVKDYYKSEIIQRYDGKCRKIEFIKEEQSKNYLKRKGKHRYYTGKLLDRLFQSEGCSSRQTDPLEADKLDHADEEKSNRHIDELKKLIFSPGQEVNVPIIGHKTAIFSKKMAPYYNFSITSKKFKGTIECYVFTAQVKPEFQNNKQDKTIIKYLETYFEKNAFNIVARNYTLEYAGALFDFDIDMAIECLPFGESFLPSFIKYDGFWDIPGRKPEIATFTITIEQQI